MPPQILVFNAEIFTEKNEIFSMSKSQIFSFVPAMIIGMFGDCIAGNVDGLAMWRYLENVLEPLAE